MKKLFCTLLLVAASVFGQATYVPNPTVVATQVAAPSPYSIANLGQFGLAAEPSLINSALIQTTIQSIATSDTAANTGLTRVATSACLSYTARNNPAEAPPVPALFYTLTYFLSPTPLDVVGSEGKLTIPTGSLFTIEAQNGLPSGPPCPAVPQPPAAGTPDIGQFLGVYSGYAYFTCISGVDTVAGGGSTTIITGQKFASGYVYNGAEGSPLVVVKTAGWGGVYGYYVSAQPLPPAPPPAQ
jgi:hypothetical protein